MKATNEIEKKILEMLEAGEPIHGWAREILIEMALRAKEEAEE